MVTEFVKDAVSVLKPPPEGAPTPEYRWRLTVATSIIVGYVLGSTVVLAIWGVFASIGFSGFAQAADVKAQFLEVSNDRRDVQQKFDALSRKTSADTRTVLATVISGQILTMAASECAAKRAGNFGLVGSISGQLSDLQARYEEVSPVGRKYPLEPCP